MCAWSVSFREAWNLPTSCSFAVPEFVLLTLALLLRNIKKKQANKREETEEQPESIIIKY